MDYSKLPRLSNTPQPTPAPAEEQSEQPTPSAPAQRSKPVVIEMAIGAEIWISLIVGVVLILMNLNFARYLIATVGGREFHTGVDWMQGDKAGQEVGYWELSGHTAMTECSLFLLGLALIFDGVLLMVVASRIQHKTPFVAVALLVTVAATLMNLFTMMVLFKEGIMPLFSIFGAGFGAYMAYYQWRILNSIRA
jgi:hypothetical protein